jgi:hypothetical protein
LFSSRNEFATVTENHQFFSAKLATGEQWGSLMNVERTLGRVSIFYPKEAYLFAEKVLGKLKKPRG